MPMPFGPSSRNRRAVFLRAFAALVVLQSADGRFAFTEFYRHDQLGNASVELLIEMCRLLEEYDMALGAFRLRDLAASLVQVPIGCELEIPGKVALMNLRDAFMRHPIDAALLDEEGGIPSLMRAALANDLMAEWNKPGADYNPARLRLQLTARAQALWLAVAKDRLSAADMRQATQDYLTWKEDQLID